MVDLSVRSGFPLSLDEGTQELVFGAGVVVGERSQRRLSELRPVLLAPDSEGDVVRYYMYRSVAREGDLKVIAGLGIRYDVASIKPGRLGPEFAKSAGHYHPYLGSRKETYPEVYEVLHGQALFLLQKAVDYESHPEVILDAVVIEAGPGDVVVVPPNYGHVTVNPGTEPLVTSNWVSAAFRSIYEPYAKLGGAAWFALASAGGGVEWRPNPRYARVPPLSKGSPSRPAYPAPLYLQGLTDPEAFRFLNLPENLDRQRWGLERR